MVRMSCGVPECTSPHDTFKFAIPFADLTGNRRVKEVSLQRREAWLKKLGKEDIGQKDLYVCADHFIGGRPSPLFAVNAVNWAPTLKLPDLPHAQAGQGYDDNTEEVNLDDEPSISNVTSLIEHSSLDQITIHQEKTGEMEIVKSELIDEDEHEHSELIIEDPCVVDPVIESPISDNLEAPDNNLLDDEMDMEGMSPLMIVPEISITSDDKNTFFSQEVEVTEQCVELTKGTMKVPSFNYNCALCEFSTTNVTGNIFYIRSRNGNIYFPCEMCQFVKITLHSATVSYMSKVVKKVNRDGSETLTIPTNESEKKRTESINNSRKVTSDFLEKHLLTESGEMLQGSQVASSSTQQALAQAQSSMNPSSPMVDLSVRGGLEKKYSCDYCPYNTTTFYRLQQHCQKDHSIERHVCPQVKCTFEAPDVSSLKEHVMNVHEGSRFPCHLCSFLATRKATLKTHIESIHEGVKYPCEECGYAATQMSALRRHVRSQHGLLGNKGRHRHGNATGHFISD